MTGNAISVYLFDFQIQMVMPGDAEEMKEFMQHCIADARITLDISIPRVNILLPSKEFMETLYNR